MNDLQKGFFRCRRYSASPKHHPSEQRLAALHLYACRPRSLHLCSHVPRMISPRLIVIRQDHNILINEVRAESVSPLPRPFRIGSGRKAAGPRAEVGAPPDRSPGQAFAAPGGGGPQAGYSSAKSGQPGRRLFSPSTTKTVSAAMTSGSR